MTEEIEEFDVQAKAKLKEFCSLIKASPEFRQKIENNIFGEKKVLYLKPFAIAACLIILIGLALFINS
jgi:hypothetical protein